MSYQHGISVVENSPSLKATVATSGVQVVVGTAPVHLLVDPKSAVNQPIVAYSLEDVKRKLGYSKNFSKFTLCESAYASFELLKVAPVIFINVLDPDKHKKSVTAKTISVANKMATIDAEGVLLETVVVKSSGGGTTTYVKNQDYTISFDDKGKPVILVLSSGAASAESALTVEYSELDATLVTDEDIIGGYDSATGAYSGIGLVLQVHPRFGIVPGQLLAPGWSHRPLVAAVLSAKAEKINGNFNAQAILDIDSETVRQHEKVAEWKETNNYNAPKSIVLWPKVKNGENILWYSAIFAARTAKLDADNEDVPFKSPSNKDLPIDAAVLPDGTEIYLDQPQANSLNAAGVVTALNWNGWKTWGNNMAVFPNVVNPQDQFISVRRMLDWWGNTFILSYFDKVDNPLDTRLIESVVDSENIRANGYQARGQIAGAKIEFRKDMNPDDQILKGKIIFNQKIGAFGPAEHIQNMLEFDPTIVSAAILGGE
ncbi:phage tail sheath family protein [Cytobacillus firmus]|uniref:phage tail sheath family protein n=1 Tax=Cytobacillus firmus TaxID=1399 RepID=UPI0018CD7A06|nr:phage tail sheath family protein [Cytobacillus firmus]MBG9548389.1 phage tail sheath protein FI [Cytobacillus firmus]MBG9604519.1 phage tail sheath protein FI [Cytobacillus firmus]MED1942137.1 phage tail sheath family protein [Cytobacillus firmus]